MAKERLYDLDRVKGFAILLVVIGHLLSGERVQGNDWFIYIHQLIYRFHMPFFMFLSGSVFFYTFKPYLGLLDFFSGIKKKAYRLLPGFFLFAVIILAGKSVLSSLIHVDDVPTSITSDLMNILINPYYSPAGSLWYIYVLFELYVVAPVFLKLLKGNVYLNLIAGIILHILSIIFELPTLFLLNMFFAYYFYFALGFVFIAHYEKLKTFFINNSLVFLIIFIFSYFSRNFIEGPYNKLVISLASIPAIFGVLNSRKIINILEKPLYILSDYTYTIYLMNTLTIGLVKGLMLKFFPWDGINFLIYLPTLVLAGTVIPILIHKFIFTRIPFLAKITK